MTASSTTSDKPANECGKTPRKLTVIIMDAEGHYLGDGEIQIRECRGCDPRKSVAIGEITVQVDKDCGCIVPIGTYVRTPR